MDVVAPLNPWERALVVKHFEDCQARARGKRFALMAWSLLMFATGVMAGIELCSGI